MSKRLIHLVLFLSGFSALFAQDNENYTQSYHWASGYLENVPHDFPLALRDEETMGTSDPGLCPEIAREQAIQRALFLYSLKRGSRMSMLTDYFIINQVATNMNDYKHEKMMVMATLHSEPQTYSFSVIREHTSIYGEQFVWLTVNSQGKEQRTLSSFYEFMLSTSKESHERQEQRLSLSIRCYNDSILKNHSFTLKGNKEKLIISTQINDLLLPLPTDLYLYKDKGTQLAQEKKEYPLSSGYWSTLLESLSDALTNFDFPGVTIQEVFESYQDTNQQLYREKTCCSLSARPVILSILNNHIFLDWSIQTIQ